MKNVIISTVLAFIALYLISTIHYTFMVKNHLVLLIGSLGATATVIFTLWEDEVSNLWNLSVGHLIGAIVGVLCQKFLYQVSPVLSISLALSLTIFLMQITKSVHPPGGAVALIASFKDPVINETGWVFIPIALIGALIIYALGWIYNEKLKSKLV